MIKDLQFDTTLQFTSHEKDDKDLQLIHKFADSSTTMDDFAIVTMTAINDRPLMKDGLRLIVSREFQEKHLSDFIGKPFVSDHRSERSEKLGRIFKSELVTEGDTTSTQVKAFIPKIADNANDIERIRLGQDREVSLGFRFSEFEEIQINGVPHVKILPSQNETDGVKEVSLVGLPACSLPDCGIHSIAASADDQPLTKIPHDDHLSVTDRDCLLFGRMMKDTLVGDVCSYERQLGITTDVKLAADSYKQMSPFALQDRRESLLNTLKKNQKRDTQVSVDAEALLSADSWEAPTNEDSQRMRLESIVAALKE